ncbi:MAG TPA: hypothetical protein VJ386_01650 [Candidatus Deferrimicrobiaceae bacterium]|jgi:hypothetical protein|nr:hypothetical protein [Candidatus Deferrimicrobiaceae bacterium]
MEAFQAASYLLLPGLLALAVLAHLRGRVRESRRSAIPGPQAEKSRGMTREAPEHRKAA